MTRFTSRSAVIFASATCFLFIAGGAIASDTPILRTSYVTDAPPILPNSVEAYGVDIQWKLIHVSEFNVRVDGGRESGPGVDGYIFLEDSASWGTSVELPIGAKVIQVQFTALDQITTGRLDMEFQAYESAFDNSSSPYTHSFGVITTGQAEMPGYGTLVLDLSASPVVIRCWEDLNGDSIQNYVSYNIVVTAYGSGLSTWAMGMFGVTFVWERTISPAPATATFPDVPTTMWAFQYVEALVASGITEGMPDGLYHPYDPVTRAQLATFLSRALGLHWPN
jgi:hypothetical protein